MFIRPAAGQPIDLLNIVVQSPVHRPGWAGHQVPDNRAGWFPLAHCGTIMATVVVDYHLTRQLRVQSGTRDALVNVYRTDYRSIYG